MNTVTVLRKIREQYDVGDEEYKALTEAMNSLPELKRMTEMCRYYKEAHLLLSKTMKDLGGKIMHTGVEHENHPWNIPEVKKVLGGKNNA